MSGGYGGGSVEAPPLYGEDAVEIEGVQKETYSGVAADRKANREAREKAEDSKQDHKPKFIQPHKDKKFKLYMKYEGRKGPGMFLKCKLPKHGGFEDGPSVAIKKMFIGKYNGIKELLSIHSIHLRSETGIAIPDEDSLSGYIGYGGLCYVVDGSSPGKLPENQIYFWGANSWSDPKGDTPGPVLTLSRKRIDKISVGQQHAMVVSEGGRVFGWGSNDFGQLGTGDEVNRALPVANELPYEAYINQIACGGRFTMALTKKGELWTWGRMQASNFPRLFVDTWCNGYEAKGENGIKGFKIDKMSAGDTHCAVVTKEGQCYTWGYNDYGQLGWGLHGVERVGQQKPNQVKGGVENEKVIDVACGGAHTVVVTESKRIFGWGSNVNGQIGIGMKQVFPEPQEVQLGEPMAKVRAGWQCTCFLTESCRPIICGGVRAEGPSLQQVQQAAAESADGENMPPAPELVQNGGGPQAESGVVDMMEGAAGVMDLVAIEAGLGEAHGLLACYDGTIRGFGYNRQAQAVGDFTDETFCKPSLIDDLPSNGKCIDVQAGGAQSYAMMKMT